MKSTDNFHSEKKYDLKLFAVSKNEWHIKEDAAKSIKNALYILRYAKRYLSG